jgi:NADPH:quinone reductase-like Zn-dependent oxidoreductase
VVAAIGLAQDSALHTTVMPFILRGVSLLGINSSDSPSREERLDVWRRLATNLRPAALDVISQTVTFNQLPSVFEEFVKGTVRGRSVVQIRS